MTVETIKDTMGAVEMRQWSEYFKQIEEASSSPDEVDWSDPKTVKDMFKL